MKQATALGILANGHSAFLTGPAGAGKTYVLNAFIKHARKEGKSVAITASTGLAATHLGGSTIHAWSGIGIADELSKRHIQDMTKGRREQIENADILIIDEVSMLHDFRLDMVDEICRSVRESEEPFGGLQVVLCGDFFQLPPINRDDGRSGGFIVGSSAWESLQPVVCYLEEQHRQADNDQLLEILSAMRANDLRRRHVESLMSRIVDESPSSDATQLYTHNIDVDTINDRKLTELESDVHEYEMSSSGRASKVEQLKRSCLAPEVLRLKKGAFVMFVKNAADKKYANGTLGHIVDFDESTDYPIVKTLAGREITAGPDTWELRDGEKKLASVAQIPLRLAWAITVHKSQGMTLDAAHIDLSKAFVEGMGYVALSRVRRLEALTLGGLNKTAISLHPEARQIDEMLRTLSKDSAVKHAELASAGEEMLRAYTSKKDKKQPSEKGSWAEKIEKMRETYPNAYRPWKPEHDKMLLAKFKKDVSIADLSAALGRHENSVRLRLHHHLGDELTTHAEFKSFDFARAREKAKGKSG